MFPFEGNERFCVRGKNVALMASRREAEREKRRREKRVKKEEKKAAQQLGNRKAAENEVRRGTQRCEFTA